MRRSLTLLATLCLILVSAGCNLSYNTTPTPSPFSIRFQSPAADSVIAEQTPLEIILVAEDSIGTGIARVDLLLDDMLYQQGTPVDAAAVPVFSVKMNWTAQGLGLHALSAIAYREDGTATSPTTIRLLVGPAQTPNT
ncbi:MAG: hypothetical protein UZ15_CFX003002787 [Chloroflexi bacterium OLB15]|nr:MAG: hypothetical protein UZ15_CFX003002787 [Chloroflexi bacterium OLB15]